MATHIEQKGWTHLLSIAGMPELVPDAGRRSLFSSRLNSGLPAATRQYAVETAHSAVQMACSRRLFEFVQTALRRSQLHYRLGHRILWAGALSPQPPRQPHTMPSHSPSGSPHRKVAVGRCRPSCFPGRVCACALALPWTMEAIEHDPGLHRT